MIRYRKTVFVSLKGMDMFDDSKVQSSLDSKTKVGPLNVVVSPARDEKGELTGYNFTGDAVCAQQADFATDEYMAKLDAAIAADLGDIGRVADDDPSKGDNKAGDPLDFVYVLNHGGLPLAYGDVIKRTFAKAGTGRVSAAAAIAELGKAIAWAVSERPELVALAGTEPQKIIEAWKSSLS